MKGQVINRIYRAPAGSAQTVLELSEGGGPPLNPLLLGILVELCTEGVKVINRIYRAPAGSAQTVLELSEGVLNRIYPH